ncbi:hypothetical protein OQA88_5907 [Cercophora sp. LCS_1]
MSGSGKIVLIIGAHHGFGLALVKAFQGKGYQVWGTVAPQDMNDASVQGLRDTGAGILPLDFTDDASVKAAANTLGEQVDHLDVLVNSAAVSTKPRHRNNADENSRFFDMLKIMAVAPLLVTLHFIPLLIKGNPGKVLDLLPRPASTENNPHGRLSHAMAEAALKEHTKHLTQGMEFRTTNASRINIFIAVVHVHLPAGISGGDGDVDLAEPANGVVGILKNLNLYSSGMQLSAYSRWVGW